MRHGIAVALVALAVIVAALGPALTLLPLSVLRVFVGFLLLAFGLQWLRKAILAGVGLPPAPRRREDLRAGGRRDQSPRSAATSSHDWYAFTLSFKGVFLEGLEVAFIVITFGAAHDNFPLMVVAADTALVVVAIVGVVIHRPLSRVPENTHEVRRRAHAHHLRDVLGRGRRRREVAGR